MAHKDKDDPILEAQTAETARLRAEIAADPALESRVRLINSAEPDVVRSAYCDMNSHRKLWDRTRAAARGVQLEQFSPEKIEPSVDAFEKAGPWNAGGIEMGSPGAAAISVIPDDQTASDFLMQSVHLPWKKSFVAALRKADGGKLGPDHEAAHPFGANEADADGAMALRRESGHEERDLPESLRLIAVARSATGMYATPGYWNSADMLLRARHATMTGSGPGEHAASQMTIRQATHEAMNGGVPGEGLQHDRSVEKATVFAREAVENDRLFNRDGKLPPAKPPTGLSMAAAVNLILMQRAVEEATDLGVKNGLTRAMPEVWKANPKAFADAQVYMHDNYGMDVTPPRPAPGRKPSPAAHP